MPRPSRAQLKLWAMILLIPPLAELAAALLLQWTGSSFSAGNIFDKLHAPAGWLRYLAPAWFFLALLNAFFPLKRTEINLTVFLAMVGEVYASGVGLLR